MAINISEKELIKKYKKWVIKATEAANKAKKQNVIKERFPEYIAADNIAKQYLSKLSFQNENQ